MARNLELTILEGATTDALAAAWDVWRLDEERSRVRIYDISIEFTDASSGWRAYILHSKGG